MKRLECLDGLRGVLAIYVMLSHMMPFAAAPAWICHPLSHGGAAVDMFFILSGLVIFRSLESHAFEAAPFLIARIARIFPVFLVMLAIGVAVQPLPVDFAAMPWIGPESMAHGIWPEGWPSTWVLEIVAHLTMIHGLFPNGILPDVWVRFLGPAWSLSTEWQFYILVLVLGRRQLGPERLAVLFLGLAAAGLAWDSVMPEGCRFSRAFLPSKAHYFALGLASAAVVERGAMRFFVHILSGVLVLSVIHGGIGKGLPPLFWTLCLFAQLYPGPMAVVAVPLRWRISLWLGAISYPIYLANEPVQKALGLSLARFANGNAMIFASLWIPAAILLPIAAAALLHWYVEVPLLRWVRGRAPRRALAQT